MKTRTRGLLVFLATIFLLSAPLPAQTTTETAPTTDTATDTSMTDTSGTETIGTQQTTTEETTTYYEGDDNGSEAEDAMACAACGGVGLLFVVLPLALSIGIAWWIYRDANQRGNPQAVLWAVLGFFFNIIGLIIYLIARPPGPGGPPTSPTV